ncbi:hypothetical protein B0J18DRAFT_12908 [Chaetomium sp. MPI-SDFR-AT-0129]|nr:hypothetical protein B0J18DRAFT_12908 [Chaetomium sp. MPI-SDFR-AT-0129]
MGYTVSDLKRSSLTSPSDFVRNGENGDMGLCCAGPHTAPKPPECKTTPGGHGRKRVPPKTGLDPARLHSRALIGYYWLRCCQVAFPVVTYPAAGAEQYPRGFSSTMWSPSWWSFGRMEVSFSSCSPGVGHSPIRPREDRGRGRFRRSLLPYARQSLMKGGCPSLTPDKQFHVKSFGRGEAPPPRQKKRGNEKKKRMEKRKKAEGGYHSILRSVEEFMVSVMSMFPRKHNFKRTS